MRCLSCENLSFQMICKNCQDNLLTPTFYKRELSKDFFVYSFYGYDEVKTLINSKYEFYGDRVFNILAKLSFKKFSDNFHFDSEVYSIAIDDHTRHEFSQTAILAKHLKSKYIKPVYSSLRAKNIIKYAGKDLEFRQKHKRNFKYTGIKDVKVILVDDMVTTGTTILEAKKVLEQNGCEVLFALTLSDAKNQ